MYKRLSIINGVILAIMVFFNGMLTGCLGPYKSTLIYYSIGLFLTIVISIIKKNKITNLSEISIIFFLPGILGVVTILFSNIAIPHIGVTLTIGMGLFGQLVMSSLVEHFGLFKMPANRLRKEKILGLSIILLGVAAMIIM